jgi:hypothetical protein
MKSCRVGPGMVSESRQAIRKPRPGMSPSIARNLPSPKVHSK